MRNSSWDFRSLWAENPPLLLFLPVGSRGKLGCSTASLNFTIPYHTEVLLRCSVRNVYASVYHSIPPGPIYCQSFQVSRSERVVSPKVNRWHRHNLPFSRARSKTSAATRIFSVCRKKVAFFGLVRDRSGDLSSYFCCYFFAEIEI